ncbi:MAG: TldD/PmbA family protein [candidate division WOR-3 bacterium]
MFDKLKAVLAGIDADYADIRYEVMHETRIGFNGPELTTLVSSSTDGFVLRVLNDGGLADISFTRPEDAGRAAKTAVENARLMAQHAKEPVRFAPTEVVKDEFRPQLDEDPRRIPVEEKLALTRSYNELALSRPRVATTQVGYVDVVREKYFVNTEGSEVREDLVTVRISGFITAQDGSLTQRAIFGLGGSDGFHVLRGREAEVDKTAGIAVDLLQARPVTSGTYRVVLDQKLGGVFTHEAFGHFSEADIIEDNPTMRQKMRLGARLGSEVVNIIDDPTRPGQLGFYKYDDEGVRARSTQLMKAGVLSGRLHSRRTAAAYNEPLSGHTVAEDYRYAPIVRMGCIYIEPGNWSREELLDQLGDGLYLATAYGGQTSGENFTFGAQYGFEVKGGKLGQMVRDINISGNLYQTLQNIRAVGNDLKLGEVGGCGKGQMNIRSCYGSPHLLIENVVVGGR